MQIESLLTQVFEGSRLNKEQSQIIFNGIVQGQLSNEQLAAFLIALKIRGETAEEISGAVCALLENAQPFPTPDYKFADIVGTGGDGSNSINISTASAIVVAAAGYKVAKHGNRSVSSKSGASDLLSQFGVNISMSADSARLALDQINLCFLFAQQYHQGFKHAVAVRQALKTRTIFNILGPLINPAHPQLQLLGVYSPHLIKHYAETLAQLGAKHSIIVHGAGMDEVAIHGDTQVAEVKDDQIEYYQLSPKDFGFDYAPLESLRGGDATENARLIQALLEGNGKKEHAQAVAMNSALLLKLFGQPDLKQNAEFIMDLLASGRAFETLTQLTGY